LKFFFIRIKTIFGVFEMKSMKIKSISCLIISLFVIGVVINGNLASASLPESSQANESLDVDGNQVLVDSNGIESTIDTEDASITMFGGTGSDTQGDIRIDSATSHDYGMSVTNAGDLSLYDIDTILPYVEWGTDIGVNSSELDLYGEGKTGTLYSNLDGNMHMINDQESNLSAYLALDSGNMQFDDIENSQNNIQLLITPVQIYILFSGYENANLSYTITGDINWGATVIFPGGVDGETVENFGGAIPEGVNISRYFGVLTIQFRGIVITLTETGIVPGFSLDISVVYFNIFLITFFDCWNWFFAGYIVFGWFFYGTWIWITFYVNWFIFELVYVFIWEYIGLKIEYYYTEVIYVIVSWWSLTIIIWYYWDIIIWEFKYVINFWIFHWNIIVNHVVLHWQWNFWFYYVYWILPVIVVTVPILYIPPVVDIDVYNEYYNAEEDILNLIYKLTDMRQGWLIGDFEPSVLRTEGFEVAVKYYKAGDQEENHYHKTAREITVVISGVVERVQGAGVNQQRTHRPPQLLWGS